MHRPLIAELLKLPDGDGPAVVREHFNSVTHARLAESDCVPVLIIDIGDSDYVMCVSPELGYRLKHSDRFYDYIRPSESHHSGRVDAGHPLWDRFREAVAVASVDQAELYSDKTFRTRLADKLSQDLVNQMDNEFWGIVRANSQP